jgi:AraC-like DNA-binding protein
MDIRVMEQLLELTDVEKRQKNELRTSDKIPPDAIDSFSSSSEKAPVLNDYFFRNKSIYISKHNRFAPYPLHSHLFFEINYVVQGSVGETVAGKKVVLNQGAILLIDTGTKHALDALGKNDILVNILFHDQNISLDFLKKIKSSKSVLYNFLGHQTTSETPPFMLVKNAHSHNLQNTIEQIINEYYLNLDYSDSIIEYELSILLLKLIRSYQIKSTNVSAPQQVVIDMLTEIKENYAHTSLKEVASKFSYSKNYLSNLFKQKTQQTFSEALTKERLLRAQDLLHNSNMSIDEIYTKVGFSNKTFFYRKFEDYFEMTPSKMRTAW